jgi:hypothetical protein
VPPVDPTHPLWSVGLRALRDLTRLAVTLLVLTLGLGATAALTGTPAAPALTSPPAATGPALVTPVSEQHTEAPGSVQQAGTTPPTTPGAVLPPPPVALPALVTEPVPGIPARRGPPRA